MKSPGLRTVALAVAAGLVLALAGGGGRASAAPGDLVADVLVPEADGMTWARGLSPSVGYDGAGLYYLDYAGSVLHRIDVPPPGASVGTGHVDAPIVGATSGIMSIAYDAGRGVFWAVGGDGLSVYLLTRSGAATLVFHVDPSQDRPGLQAGPAATEVKIAYDRSDDTLWYAPDATTRIYHYRTAPDVYGTAALVPGSPYVDVDVAAECGFSQTSGVAVGGSSLFVSVAGCPRYFELTKTGAKVGAYAYTPAVQQSTQDVECDDHSYTVLVFWIKDGYDGHIRAFEQPRSDACRYGGGP